MNRKQRLGLVLLVALIGLTWATVTSRVRTQPPVPQIRRVGVVDTQRVFDEYEKSKQAVAELQRASQRLDEQAQALRKEIKDLQERLIKQRLFIEDRSQLDAMERQILSKQQELDQLVREGQQALQERYDELSEPILREIRDIIHEIGQRDGYDLILEKQYIVLYHQPAMDLTDTVIRLLNERAVQEGAPAAGEGGSSESQ